ncbi:MAG: hypothetical protein DCC56_00555 [Anaerolineae bacterium]|nr:MAG: hypothetical protein DCC56_00555 [Anaerolineae bacterium]WKZ44524.1 MAG: RsiV family protein [Anaerolineales bacterium]
MLYQYPRNVVGGFVITFDEYQVAPYAADPQTVTVPYSELKPLINQQGPLVVALR